MADLLLDLVAAEVSSAGFVAEDDDSHRTLG
jgi:hypothetical protein